MLGIGGREDGVGYVGVAVRVEEVGGDVGRRGAVGDVGGVVGEPTELWGGGGHGGGGWWWWLVLR